MITDEIVHMINNTLSHEGGEANVKNDHGGLTKYGITKSALAEYRNVDISQISDQDIHDLTKQDAFNVIKQNFYLKPHIDELPEEIQPIVMDMAVMSYPKTAIRILQRSISNYSMSLADDGLIGANTVRACKQALNAAGEKSVISSIVQTRITFLKHIVSHDITQEKFLAGWTARTKSFLV